MKRRHICIHGHFYQPPREDPWLGLVPQQPSAAPFHDWNERIAVECYHANSKARLQGEEGVGENFSNNYASISFNFGPTLLSWMQDHSPATYARILDADLAGAKRFNGRGPAMAQAYNHMIMPLANARDKRTQVLWGLRDFERRFGRKPEGMWLPETAVDLPTLGALAEAGIAFTLLEPHQAARWRRPGEAWSGEPLDASQPYRVALPGGKFITVFFYEGALSRAIAFEGLLKDGGVFADRLTRTALERAEPSLTHVATDGESYGHHHRYGEMALAYAISRIETDPRVELTHYAAYLAANPAVLEAEIKENTSWSCAHGVERWRSNCGCEVGGHKDQSWRAPLRAALDGLRDTAALFYEKEAKFLLSDPWSARDDFVEVVLDRSTAVSDSFLERRRAKTLAEADKVRALKLLELQRHAMLMYTSCGWFFDDFSRIETLQILRYAARALELLRELGADDAEPAFVAALSAAQTADGRDGAAVWKTEIIPGRRGMLDVAALLGLMALDDRLADKFHHGAFSGRQEDTRASKREDSKLALGVLALESRFTREATQIVYAYLKREGQPAQGGVFPYPGRKAYEAFAWETTNVYFDGKVDEAGRLIAEALAAASRKNSLSLGR